MGREAQKPCEYCGVVFGKDPRNTWKYWEKARFCSSKCFGLAEASRKTATRPPIAKAFALKVAKACGCWEWTGLKDKDGYGLFPYARKLHRASKIALELDGRAVPSGMYACHTCDNPGCVRPDHLYPGTPTQNVADMISRGRSRISAKLTAADVIAIRSATGSHRQIAGRFGVSPSNVTQIRQRKTWRHVT